MFVGEKKELLSRVMKKIKVAFEINFHCHIGLLLERRFFYSILATVTSALHLDFDEDF